MAEQIAHERFRDAIYADQVVDGLDEHLAGCEECRSLAARLERIDQANRDAPTPEPRPELVDDVLARTTGAARPGVAVGLILMRDERVLLGRRLAPAHGHGTYGAIGGRLRFGETFGAAVRREAREEAGVDVLNLRWVCVVNVAAYGCHYVGPQALCADFEGEPELREPNRVESWAWYPLDDLPAPLFVPVKLVLARLSAPGLSVVEHVESERG